MKKLIALLLAFVFMFSFAACENADDYHNEDEDEDTSEVASKDPTETETKPENTENSEKADGTEATEDSATTPPTVPQEEKALPVSLHELPAITTEATTYKNAVKDSYGNAYEGPYYDFCSWGRSNKDGEYITQSFMEYNAGGKYQYLTGTIFTRSKQLEEHSIELLVYADDVLIFQSEPLTRRDEAIDLAVDIGNCEVLRIASRSYDFSGVTNPGIILAGGMVCNEITGELTESVAINYDMTPLTDLHVYGDHSNALDNISAGAVEDSYGNIYKGVYLELVSYGNYGGREYDTQAYTDFVTNGEYTYFSGTIFTRATQSENYTIEFLVYADDQLVYSSGMIDRNTKAVDFCVEIEDCEILRVMSRSVNYTDSGTNPGILLVDAVVSTSKP